MATGIGTGSVDMGYRPGMACERAHGRRVLLTFRAILGRRWQRGTGVAPWTRGHVWHRFSMGLVLRHKPSRVFPRMCDRPLCHQPESSFVEFYRASHLKGRGHVVKFDIQRTWQTKIKNSIGGVPRWDAWGCNSCSACMELPPFRATQVRGWWALRAGPGQAR